MKKIMAMEKEKWTLKILTLITEIWTTEACELGVLEKNGFADIIRYFIWQ